MKIFIIIICKATLFIGKLFKRGSSLPGAIALKLDKNIISKLDLPKKIIIVTGSNGKTSTTELISSIYKDQGFKVGTNSEGSNQTEGVTTTLIKCSNIFGKIKKDVLVLESDERYLRRTTKYIKPSTIIVTNIYRDQMTRNGHPEIIFDIIKDGINDDADLILNADDPLSSLLGYKRKNVTYVGINENELSTKKCENIYNDGEYCPNCKEKMIYDYYHFDQVGKYKCTSCDFKREETSYFISALDITSGTIEINNKYKINISFGSLYSVYNTLEAFALASLEKLDIEKVLSTLNNYHMKNGRVQQFNIGNTPVTLLTSKHENIICYNEHLKYITRKKENCRVLILVDAISRKYFTSEMSWIWDIDFELLKSDNIKKIIIAGKYANDLDIRLSFVDNIKEKIIKTIDLDDMIDEVKKDNEKVYLLTCFSDRMKVLNRR